MLIALAGTVPHAWARQVDWRSVVRFGLPGMTGAWLGASLAHYVPGMVQLADVPMLKAAGTSLAVIAINALTGFAKYVGVLGAKGLVLDWHVLLLVAAVGIVGSVAGHRIGQRLPQLVVRRLFGVALLSIATAMVVDLAGRL